MTGMAGDELDEVRAQLASAQRDLRQARTELDEARRELGLRTQEALGLGERLAGVEGSLVWRLAAPPRAFVNRHPRLARRVRRGVEDAYWAVTLQLPARLRERRRAGAGAEAAAYTRWVELYDTLGEADLAALPPLVARLTRAPLVSLLLCVGDPASADLTATIASLVGQAYERWELCLVDCRPADAGGSALLDQRAARDPRIRAVHADPTRGAAAALDAALRLARGELVALLDEGDVLRPHSLLLLLSALDDAPGARLAYSDEDRLDAGGRRVDAFFKPDWNPELLLSVGYVGGLALLGRADALDAGGFRPEADGCHAWDLLLRVTARLEARGILHVPHVLLHRRPRAGALEPGAGARVVADRLASAGIEADVIGGAFQEVRYPLPAPPPTVEAIVPTAFGHAGVERFLHGLLHETEYAALRVTLVVSDALRAAPDEAARLERVEAEPRVGVVAYSDRPFNYARVNNLAVARSTADVICLVNDDLLVIHPGWLGTMVAQLMQDRVGAVGAMLYYPDDTIQHGGVVLGVGGVAAHYHRLLPRGAPGYHGRARRAQDLSCVTAACMVLRREAFDDAGGFDEGFAVAFNDVDLCLRLRGRGWRVVWTPHARLYHPESTSFGRHDSAARREQFELERRLVVERWGGELLSDPHYSPNLSLVDQNAPAFPPRRPYPWRGSPAAPRT